MNNKKRFLDDKELVVGSKVKIFKWGRWHSGTVSSFEDATVWVAVMDIFMGTLAHRLRWDDEK